MKKISLTTVILVLLLFSFTLAARMEHISERIDSEGADEIVIQAELGAGEFTFTTDDISEVALIEVDYDSRTTECDISYNVKRSTGYLMLESSNRRSHDVDTDDNQWNVTLSTRYNTSIDMEIGACDAEIDFGGIPLEEVSIEVGAASGVIDFSKPNPVRLRELSIDAGASSIELVSVGNANFDEFTFSGGVGSFEIDLRGKYDGESEVEIEIGLGSADIILPRDVAVQIETEDDNWLSSIEIHDDDLEEIDDGIYETPDFDRAENRIVVIIEVGLGSVDIYRKD